MRFLNLALTFFFVFQTSSAFAQNQAAPTKEEQVATPTATPTFGSKKALLHQGEVTQKVQSCNNASNTARNYCLAKLNSKIQSAAGLIGVLLSGTAALRSVSESCQKYNQALKIAEMALTAYNGMCTAAEMNCESACGDADKILTTVDTELMTPTPEDAGIAARDREILQQPKLAIANKLDVCRAYKMNLAAAGVGLMNVVKQSALSSTCTNATTVADCSKDPMNPACAAAQVDCSKPENQSNTQCVCQRAPNTAGCPGAIGQSGIMPTTGAGGSLSGQSADKITPPNLSGTDSTPVGAGAAASTGGGSMAGSGAGGGGGGMGGGANKTGAADGKKEKTLNPNILSGYDGGGGGGGGRGGGGRGDNPNSAYNAYLPGGAKDPSRGLASKTFGNGEVTSAGSKSNWEKISERYKDSKPTLMGP